MPYLVVEDFGTRGLSGSPEQYSDSDETNGRPKDFFYFWRNIGRSRKQEMERGRWGLGKSVFPASSRINSFFGFTVRAEDGRSLLMGQSVLKVHRVNGTQFCPYGFFARLDPENFQLPFEDPERIRQFCRDFRLRRNDEPGLSVVVPFPDEKELTTERMQRAAILHYFYPILRRELLVEVSDGDHEVLLNADTIADVAQTLDWSELDVTAHQLQRLFGMVKRIAAIPTTDFITLGEPPNPRSPEWGVGRFDAVRIEAMKDKFAAGEIIPVRVPVTIKPKTGPMLRSHFDVFVQHDGDLNGPEDHFIRQGITITKIDTLREKGFRVLVVVDDKPLSTLLGDAENPAHTDWQERATRLKERYEWGPFTVRFVRHAPQRIVTQLLVQPEGRDEKALIHVFYLDLETDEGQNSTRTRGRRQKPGGPEPPPAPPPRRPPQVLVERIVGGFRIRGNSASVVRPTRVKVKAAYEVRKGKPFKKYDRLDFTLDARPIAITAVGADCLPAGNALEITPTDDHFLVEVTGFDPHRDLRILVDSEVADAAEVQLHGAEEDQPIGNPPDFAASE